MNELKDHKEIITGIIASTLGRDVATTDTPLNELGADSMDIMEINIHMEMEYNIEFTEAEDAAHFGAMATVDSLADFIGRKLVAP